MAREYIALVPVRPSTRWLSTGVAARCDPEGQERGTMRRMEIGMELTEALVSEDITPFERERQRGALEEEVEGNFPPIGGLCAWWTGIRGVATQWKTLQA